MQTLLILTLLLLGAEEKGWLTIETIPSGLEVYIDGELVGKSPLKNVEVSVGRHTVSLFSSDTIENAYFRVRRQGVLKGILSLPELSKYDAGTVEVDVKAKEKTKILFNYKEVINAPRRTRFFLYGCLGGIFASGVIAGVIISSLF